MIRVINLHNYYFGWYHDEPYRKKEIITAERGCFFELYSIRLDLYYGLRREVARIAMPFGQVPEGFLFCL